MDRVHAMTDGSENRADAALLLIDVINDLNFEQGESLRGQAEPIIDPIRRLRADADKAGLPVIHVNDNFGDWGAGLDAIVDHCLCKNSGGQAMVERLRPRPTDLFVVKPAFSGFYATTLPALLPRLGVKRLVLAGVAADICVLFTAADAHMREYPLWVPRDAVASNTPQHRDWAVEIMAKSMGAEICATTDMTLAEWLG
jgi:nicotinamidase-related amidase